MQWKNYQQIKKFVNLERLYITCKKSGGLDLAELGITVGGWLTKFGQGLKFYKLTVDRNIRFFGLFSQGTALF